MNRPDIADVVIIVGAGISKEPPSDAPNFEEIRDVFLGRALGSRRSDANGIDADRLSPEQVFDALDDGLQRSKEEVRRELWWRCETRTPNRNHAALAQLIDKGAKVWTPNFDTMIERAGVSLGCDIHPITPDGGLAGARERSLLKPHGSFPFPGQPPKPLLSHDYDLLFQASQVWRFDPAWEQRMKEDIRDRHVFLFGYRGADPDLTPAILAALEESRSASWWEFPPRRESDNYFRLQNILDPEIVHLRAGNPSEELQKLAAGYVEVVELKPEFPLPERPPESFDYHPTNVAKAKAAGLVSDSARARRYLLRALLKDEGLDRREIALILLRSLAFDRAVARPPLVRALSLALSSPRMQGSNRRRVAEVYASIIDSRPIRPSDMSTLARLRAFDQGGPGILVRTASIAKLHGDLGTARSDAEQALSMVHEKPALEAMAVYNLAWIYRQQGEFAKRVELLERMAERRSHIGLNWAAWLAMDDMLLELQLGRAEAAREIDEDQFMRFAKERIGHSFYKQDAEIAEALLRWHVDGVGAGGRALGDAYSRTPIRPLLAPRFSSVAGLILLADQCRAAGDTKTMNRHLRKATRKARSRLQQAQIRLVVGTAMDDCSSLRELRRDATVQGFGLIADTVDAVLDSPEGRRPTGERVCFRNDLPLPALY